MKKLMKKLWEKKDSKKGFTLVELIVVLVILAILAAIMVPALTGWIDKAKEKQVMLDARNFEMAAQAALYQEYAEKGKTDKNPGYSPKGTDELSKYIDGVIGTDAAGKIDDAEITTDEKGTIIGLKYTAGGYTATYAATGEDAGWKIGPEESDSGK